MNVTFCGHGEIFDRRPYIEWLDTILPKLIEQGADAFYLGGYGAFDHLAAHAVKRQKAKYPHIESILVIPYLNREYNMSLYDSSTYPPLETVPPRFAISKRNEWMIQNCDIVVSGVTHDWGGAAKTLHYAWRKNRIIVQYPETNFKL